MAHSKVINDENTKIAFQHFLEEHPEYRFGQALTIFLHNYIGKSIRFVYMAKEQQDDENLKDMFYFEFDKDANNGI